MDSALSWMQSGLAFSSYKTDSDTWNGVICSWKYCSHIFGSLSFFFQPAKVPQSCEGEHIYQPAVASCFNSPQDNAWWKRMQQTTSASQLDSPLGCFMDSWHSSAACPSSHSVPILLLQHMAGSSWSVLTLSLPPLLWQDGAGQEIAWSVFSISVLCPSAGLHSILMQISGNL